MKTYKSPFEVSESDKGIAALKTAKADAAIKIRSLIEAQELCNQDAMLKTRCTPGNIEKVLNGDIEGLTLDALTTYVGRLEAV